MVFISIEFYLFVAAVLVFYYIMPLKYRWYVLLLGSAVFYYQLSKENWWMFAVAALISYIAGIGVFRGRESAEKKYLAKGIMVFAIVTVLLPLLITKGGIGIWESLYSYAGFNWIVPLGLSFYTLQMISYVADIYRGKIEPQRNIFKYLLFVSFFPQMVQGPIPRYEQLGLQLYEEHKFDEKKFTKGIHLIIWGFFLKLMIADKAAVIVDEIFLHSDMYVGWYVILAGILYSVQLYTDFQACVCIAKGVAGLFGIQLIDNFQHPYKAKSVKEFWHRWHISLSTWLRDYIYIPLGGNRKGIIRKYLNLIITFAISGVWHGSGIKFIFWGLMHAFYQIAGDILTPIKTRARQWTNIEKYPQLKGAIQTVVTFILVMAAWIIFRAETLKQGIKMLLSIFRVNNIWVLFNDGLFELGLGWKECIVLLLAILVLGIVSRLQQRDSVSDMILRQPILIRWALYIIAVVVIFVFGTYGYGFVVQDFIYGGF